MREINHWKNDIKLRAKVLHKRIAAIAPLYGSNPVVPTESELTHAFALCLVDIGRYCKDNQINANNIDTVKLISFSIPYLLATRSYSLRLDMYALACFHLIHGGTGTPSLDDLVKTTEVIKRLCLQYPSQHMVVYGYLKGYQESLEINTI